MRAMQGNQEVVTAAAVRVVPSAISLPACTLIPWPAPTYYTNQSILMGVAGQTGRVQLTLRDAFGNQVLTANISTLRLLASPANASQHTAIQARLTWQGGGTVQGSFAPKAAGNYTVAAFWLSPGGAMVEIASLPLVLGPGPVDLSSCSVHSLPARLTAGAPAIFGMTMRDASGNAVSSIVAAHAASSCLQLRLHTDASALSGPSVLAVPFQVSPAANGSANVSLTPSATGSLRVWCQANGQALMNTSSGRLLL